jgi:peroxiredoxin Q/BCP
MSRTIHYPLLLLMTLFAWLNPASADDLKVGDPAPDFSLIDQTGERQQLQDYRDRWLVLYFYPKNDTPGCTTEACNFRDDIYQLRRLQVALLGVSLDDSDSHRRFAEKYSLPFPLLADTEGRVAAAYGSLFSMGPLRFAKRHTFVIDPQGRIAAIYRDVEPKEHSQELIADLERLLGKTG